MPKILSSDRDVNTPSANQDPLKRDFHDFDSMPKIKGVYHGSDAEGHHFICNGNPVLVSAEEVTMHRVNYGLSLARKGAVISIQYLGWNDTEKRGNYEVTDEEQE